jgi:hypothetical protein
MGLVIRKKSGQKIFSGSKLNVQGQGISTVKVQPQDKVVIKQNTSNIDN